jgi:hypothetical protein
MPRRRWKFGFAVHAAAASDRRQGGLCCGRSAAIKPCASGAPQPALQIDAETPPRLWTLTGRAGEVGVSLSQPLDEGHEF